MGNPILEDLSTRSRTQQTNNDASFARNALNVLRNSQNPQQALSTLAMQNPNLQQVINMVGNSGQDSRSMFYALAKAKGVDPNQILNLLR